MKKIFTLVLIVSAFLFACNNSDQSPASESGTSDQNIQNTEPAKPDGAAQLPATDNSGAMTTPPAPASLPPPSPQQATTAPGMNPPHGQPGHRCDIAVGAPLNSAPATPTAPSSSPSVTVNPGSNAPAMTPTAVPAPSAPSAAQASPATATTAPGMNPPHGQPGHDCSVPVGSPLPKK